MVSKQQHMTLSNGSEEVIANQDGGLESTVFGLSYQLTTPAD